LGVTVVIAACIIAAMSGKVVGNGGTYRKPTFQMMESRGIGLGRTTGCLCDSISMDASATVSPEELHCENTEGDPFM